MSFQAIQTGSIQAVYLLGVSWREAWEGEKDRHTILRYKHHKKTLPRRVWNLHWFQRGEGSFGYGYMKFIAELLKHSNNTGTSTVQLNLLGLFDMGVWSSLIHITWIL